MTAPGYAALEEELRRRQQEERPRIIQAIAEARSHGDLSENAEYHAAKEQQSLNEGRIAELEDKLSRAEIIDISKLSGDTVMFGATSKSAAWYLGLKGAGTAAVGDTASSHAGWSEVTGYSETVRQTLTLASFSSGTANNSGSPAVFTINASVTVAGVFAIDNSTKGGTSGTIYSAGDFSGGSVALSSGTITVSAYALSF